MGVSNGAMLEAFELFIFCRKCTPGIQAVQDGKSDVVYMCPACKKGYSHLVRIIYQRDWQMAVQALLTEQENLTIAEELGL
jgi:DNA-directed RNA polymerase subunit M/transcription elongation factor TFIIS